MPPSHLKLAALTVFHNLIIQISAVAQKKWCNFCIVSMQLILVGNMAAWFLRHGVAFWSSAGTSQEPERSIISEWNNRHCKSRWGERVFSSSVSHSGLIVFNGQSQSRNGVNTPLFQMVCMATFQEPINSPLVKSSPTQFFHTEYAISLRKTTYCVSKMGCF